MSQTKRRKYVNGMITSAKILKILALNEDFAQYDLPKEIDRRYRQVIRCLHDLRDKDLIYLKRREQSEKGGKEKNFWAITFHGLIEVLKYLDDKEINSVAQKHRGQWLIFAEWPYLLRKAEEWLYILVRQVSCRFHVLRANTAPKFTDEEIKQMGFTPKEWEERENQMRAFLLENTRQECTDMALGLDDLFGSRERFSSVSFLLSIGKEGMAIEAAKRKMRRFMDNQKIREYIDKRVEQETAKNKLFNQIKIQWEKQKRRGT